MIRLFVEVAIRRCLSAFCLAAAALTPGVGAAGAWSREEGTVFLSFGANLALSAAAERPVHYDPTVYVEYRWSERLTLGLDGYTADKGEAGSLFAFARMPIGRNDGAARLAFSLGVGAVAIPTGSIEPSFRVGLHWGRGLVSGWLAVDAELVHAMGADRQQSKVDVTWGYRFSDAIAAVVTGQAGTGLEGDNYAKISPTLVWQATDRISLRAGAVHALTGDRGTGLMTQVWLTF